MIFGKHASARMHFAMGHSRFYAAHCLLVAALWLLGCSEPGVVVYTAHDQPFSKPVLRDFTAATGITARAKYDTEANKTLGLTLEIRAEKNRPRCDVFWNNEILNTIRLQEWGLLEPVKIERPGVPTQFSDPEGHWYGFAARARVLIVNNKLVPPGEEPRSIFDLAQPEWKGRVGIAKPLFGTTATHVAALFAKLGDERAAQFLRDLKANGVSIESGNRMVARKVARGELAVGLTDTDDANVEIQEGSPVRIVFPDSAPDGIGTLLIPNTVCAIKGRPHPGAARPLMEYLLSAEIEGALAKSRSAQIPLNPAVTARPPLPGLDRVKFMEVDFRQAAAKFDAAQKVIQDEFLK